MLIGMLDMTQHIALDEVSARRIDFVVALDPSGRSIVKRDMELIRKILLEVEGWPDAKPKIVTIGASDRAVVARHVEDLKSAGYLDVAAASVGQDGVPIIMVKDLSWEGHDFLDAVEKRERVE